MNNINWWQGLIVVVLTLFLMGAIIYFVPKDFGHFYLNPSRGFSKTQTSK